MVENKYQIIWNNTVIAEVMDINTALILIRALFHEYYDEENMKLEVARIDDR